MARGPKTFSLDNATVHAALINFRTSYHPYHHLSFTFLPFPRFSVPSHPPLPLAPACKLSRGHSSWPKSLQTSTSKHIQVHTDLVEIRYEWHHGFLPCTHCSVHIKCCLVCLPAILTFSTIRTNRPVDSEWPRPE